jgi:hypothetical protein
MLASCNNDILEERSVLVHKDSVKTITRVHVLSYPDEPLVLLLQDASTTSVCYSYIHKEGSDSLILLPSCGDFLGVSYDDGLIIMDSYYYDDKGRHGVIQGYTFDGEKVCEMKTKINEK